MNYEIVVILEQSGVILLARTFLGPQSNLSFLHWYLPCKKLCKYQKNKLLRDDEHTSSLTLFSSLLIIKTKDRIDFPSKSLQLWFSSNLKELNLIHYRIIVQEIWPERVLETILKNLNGFLLKAYENNSLFQISKSPK